jgi:hypothetical protein
MSATEQEPTATSQNDNAEAKATTGTEATATVQQQQSEGQETAPEQTKDGDSLLTGAKPPDTEQAAEEPGAPESYELAPPTMGDLESDRVKLAAVENFEVLRPGLESAARDLNLPNDKAQTLVDHTIRGLIARDNKAHDEMMESVKADAEIGGEKLEENLSIAMKAVDKINPALKPLLSGSIGSHPEVIRTLYRVGMAISEERSFLQGNATRDTKDLSRPDVQASILYGDDK